MRYALWFVLASCPSLGLAAPSSRAAALNSCAAAHEFEGAPTDSSRLTPSIEGERTDGVTPAQQDDREREANRILHLSDGRIVRARARWSNGHWEVLEKGAQAGQSAAWSALPAGAVVKEAREREVVARGRSLLAKVRDDDATQRVGVADWMLREGLVDEALAELDRVLADEPDNVNALRLLAGPPIPLAAPGSSASDPMDALRIASTRPRVVHELALAALARRADQDAVQTALRSALGSHSPRLRAFAALGLRRLLRDAADSGSEGTSKADARADADDRGDDRGDDRSGFRAGEPTLEPWPLRELLGRAVLDGAESVRREACFALRDTGESGVITPVVRALGSEHSVVRANAAEALGNLGFAAAVEPLMARLATIAAPSGGSGGWRAPGANIFVGRQIAYVQDYDVEVAQFSSIADPQINVALEGSALDVRVIGVTETSIAVESRRIRSSLAKLTGANPGASNRSWLDWWEQNKSEFGVRSAPRPGPITPRD